MTTIANKLETINNSLQDIKSAIIAKGQTPEGNITTYATAIANIQTEPTLASLTVTPSTTAQTLTPPSGTDGYNTVQVSAVTASIDSDIVAGNIKSGANILGVTGTVTELNGSSRSVSLTSSSGQTFNPETGKNAITSITVTPNNQARTVTPTTSQQSLTVGSGYSGNGTITVNAVTSSIDNNIIADNIKKDVTILGVTGTYEGSGGGGISTLYAWRRSGYGKPQNYALSITETPNVGDTVLLLDFRDESTFSAVTVTAVGDGNFTADGWQFNRASGSDITF